MESKRWAPPASSRPTTSDGPDGSKHHRRMTCRRCTQSFDSRNKLMRHVFRDHSPPGAARHTVNSGGGGGGSPANPRAGGPIRTTLRGNARDHPPASPESTATATTTTLTANHTPPIQILKPPAGDKIPLPRLSSVHPFLTLSKEQQILYTLKVLYILFSVAMKQHAEDEQMQHQTQGFVPFIAPSSESPDFPLSPASVDTQLFFSPPPPPPPPPLPQRRSTLNPKASEFVISPPIQSFREQAVEEPIAKVVEKVAAPAGREVEVLDEHLHEEQNEVGLNTPFNQGEEVDETFHDEEKQEDELKSPFKLEEDVKEPTIVKEVRLEEEDDDLETSAQHGAVLLYDYDSDSRTQVEADEEDEDDDDNDDGGVALSSPEYSDNTSEGSWDGRLDSDGSHHRTRRNNSDFSLD
ncbi:hypothetical protein QBC35DRAFT_505522 [Podospora australis]|uniref:C2H2-type domain-containing protein n=1 Tax=Podospora australis TaxID=1536484 RepID=A0AAN6WMP7_9PEZI|nr:hypothetical protein QBC35DRAFT_505522 [Podospora australis]